MAIFPVLEWVIAVSEEGVGIVISSRIMGAPFMTVNVASVRVLTHYSSKTDTKHLDAHRPIQEPSARYYTPRPKRDLQRERAPLSCGRALFKKQILGRVGIAWGFHNIERVRNSGLGPPETEEGHDS
jgi:hypothetical protein